MATIVWKIQGLTDSQLSAKLNSMSSEYDYTKVYLHNNNLQTMPEFSRYRQFKGLEVLYLSFNQITTLDPQSLPLNLRELHMVNNKVTEVGDLSQHQQLNKLCLSDNDIIGIVPHKLPRSLLQLNMSNNNISEVGDLSRHEQLVILYLSGNHIAGIDPHQLPIGIRFIDMSHNDITEVGDFSQHQELSELSLTGNSIVSIHPSNADLSCWGVDILGEKFFENEDGYNFVCRSGFDFSKLEQPPIEVFRRGVKSVLSYYKDMRLTKGVRHSRKRLVLLGPTEAGKTSLAESLTTGEAILVNIRDRTQVINIKYWNITEDDIIHIYEHGGHMIYSITSPHFISKESTIFLVHDVCKVQGKEVDQTIEILRQALHQYPENEMHIILTHSDLLSEDEVESNGYVLTGAIQLFLDEEINRLDTLLKSKQSKNEDQVLIDATQKILKLLSLQKMKLSCYKVSCNYDGVEEVKEDLEDKAENMRNPVPESWVQFYKTLIDNKKHYLTFDETVVMFKDISHSPYDASNESRAIVSLQYFTDTNLVLHYDKDPILKDYVFHDILFLVELFKPLFHKISEMVNYETDEQLQSMFKRVECDVAVKHYQNEGLLSRKLLSYLWDHYGLKFEDENVLIELMHVFNICATITIDEEDSLQYFPWLVQSQKCPPNVDRDNLMIFGKQHSSVHLQCDFFTRIPLNVFENICVCLQKKATKESLYVGDRHAWHDGLLISFGSVECILMRSPENSTIDICLRGKLKDIPDIWKVVDSLLADFMSVLHKYHGIIYSVHFLCGHCKILGISPPSYWLPEQVFLRGKSKSPRFIQCPKGGEKDIPAALVVAIFKDGDANEKQSSALKDVAEYLESNWS